MQAQLCFVTISASSVLTSSIAQYATVGVASTDFVLGMYDAVPNTKSQHGMYSVVCTTWYLQCSVYNMVCTILAASLQLPCHVLIVSYQAACVTQKHILGLGGLIEAMRLAANGMASIQVSTEIEIVYIGVDST